MNEEVTRLLETFRVDQPSGPGAPGIGRFIVFDADAFGDIRRELMDNLGWEGSRGIFERVGFQSGRNDALGLQVRFPWPSEGERPTGDNHPDYFKGMARVRVANLEIHRADGKLRITGEWPGSHEADQHVRHHGLSVQPVCWTLEGYTTGFASQIFSQQVVCIETRCRAKGDPACSFELRTAFDWGPAAQPILEMLLSQRYAGRIERCLRSINEMGCELEQVSVDAIVTTDAHGAVTSCSQGACNLLGLLPGEAHGKALGNYLAGGAIEERRLMARLKGEGRVRNFLTEAVTPTGHRKAVSLSASAIRNSSGEILGTLEVVHDLTEIRRLEDELAGKNRFMANILQDSADAIITLGLNDEITSWNRGAEAIFGYSSEEAVGRSIRIIVPPDLQEDEELVKIREKLRTQGVIKGYQTERITKDGRRIHVIFTRTAIRDDRGSVAGSSVVLKDVTTYKSLERQLADAEHLATLGELSAGLAHEIKNPLAGIKGAIEVIRDSIPLSDLHSEVLGDVIHQVDRIDQIVRDLLNYAKPKPPSHSDVNLPEVVQRIVTMFRKSAKGDSLSIRVHKLSDVPDFTGDETQLEQVLLNLLLNAQNAMPRGGHIEIRLSYDPTAGVIKLVVEDDGPGIHKEHMKRLFQPFFTTRTDGIGLGLAICRKNIQYHGGNIEVQSQVGRGTTITVSLPLVSRL
jgi:PAS domain S-box-containing protein